MSIKDTLATAKGRAMVAVGSALALAPGFAFAEEGGGSATTSNIQGAITDMATTVSNDAVNMLVAVIPVLAPIAGAVIVAGLGYKFVRRFSR